MSLPISCLLFLIMVDCSFVLTVEAFNNVSVNKCCGVGQYYDEKGDECRKVAWELAADEPTWMVPGALLYDSEDELEFRYFAMNFICIPLDPRVMRLRERHS